MKKRVLCLLSAAVMMFSLLPMRAMAAEALNSAPYAKIEYGYSSNVTCGTIRYISQMTSDRCFNWNYWPKSAFGEYSAPDNECGTASTCMALSYIGINITPKNVLEPYNGTTHIDLNWGGATYKSAPLSVAIGNYVSGGGKYSPVVVCLSRAGSWNSKLGRYNDHYVIIAGKVNSSSYQIVDPADSAVSIQTINGSSMTYKSGSYTIKEVHQWYNHNADGGATTETFAPSADASYYSEYSDVKVSWPSVSNAAYYVIQISKDGKVQLRKSVEDATSYTASKAKAGEYEFRVWAYDVSGNELAVGYCRFYVNHNYTAVVTAPTCTERGYTTYVCSCGDSYKGDYIDALGHDTELRNVREATSTEEGYTGDLYCKACGELIESGEIIPIAARGGDLNGDGKVNALDLVRLAKYLADTDTEIIGTADITGDGRINALDLVRLKKNISASAFIE